MSDVLTEAPARPRCDLCDKEFKNALGLAGHNRAKHQPVEATPQVEGEPQVEVPQVEVKAPGLEPYPFADGSVNENAAIRMVRMVIPNCTADPNPEILKKDGTSVPNPRYTGEPNCQQAYKINDFGRWDVAKCVSLGHDPYYTTFRKTVVEDVVGPDGYVTESRQRVKSERRLNVIQVSDNPRHSSRMEIQLAVARGCKFLEEFGIEAPCEFRGCTRKVQVNTRYGKFCSERHARLVAADAKSILLPVGGDVYSEEKAMEERNSILENLNIGRTT